MLIDIVNHTLWKTIILTMLEDVTNSMFLRKSIFWNSWTLAKVRNISSLRIEILTHINFRPTPIFGPTLNVRSTLNFWPRTNCTPTPKFRPTPKSYWPTPKFYKPTQPTRPTPLTYQWTHVIPLTQKLVRSTQFADFKSNK